MLFQKLECIDTVAFENEPGFKIIKEQNRIIINAEKEWINEDLHKTSIFGYGIPDEIFTLINLPLNHDTIYTDLIVAASKLLPTINYLELGVSVGKNAWPVINALERAHITLWDVENPPPVLQNHLENWSMVKEWSSPGNSMRKDISVMQSWQHGTNVGKYIAADILLDSNWRQLGSEKYNLIFSDAFHSPEAILKEYKMIKQHKLLADDFIIFYDDLHAHMLSAFDTIGKELCYQYPFKRVFKYLIHINGWLGQNYPHKHPVGILSSIKLD